jgi:hypothetical protein
MKFRNTILLTATLSLLVSTLFAQKKITYGISLDIFQTKLNNVDRENFSGYGHSVPEFKQNDRLGFGLTFLASKPIYKNFSFETGLGGTNFNSQFLFRYYDQNRSDSVNTKFNISLYYLKIPLLISYNYPINSNSKLNFSIGADLRFLLLSNDNFDKINNYFINLGNNRYHLFIPSLITRIGYTANLKSNKRIRAEFFIGKDLNTIMTFRWGFYENLSTASYLNYGLSLQYFFTK